MREPNLEMALVLSALACVMASSRLARSAVPKVARIGEGDGEEEAYSMSISNSTSNSALESGCRVSCGGGAGTEG